MPLQKQFKISLLGDDGIDEYQYGTIDRLSAEAPVPIFKYIHNITLPGMAANVRENLQVLGCNVDYHRGATSFKTRLIDEKSKYHICRIDRDFESFPIIATDIDLNVDAIVISDYNKGSISYELVEYLRREYDGPIFIDSKKPDLKRFEGCVVKINEPEFNARTSLCNNLIVTRGGDSVFCFPYEQCQVPIKYPVEEVTAFDVCGAGDTFLAALTYKYIETYNLGESIQFAIKAAKVTVQHIGVYAPTLKEIYEA